MARTFRFRVRGGHLFRLDGASYRAGDEMVVDESMAAKVLRQARTGVELVKVIDDRRAPRKKLPG